MTSDRSFKRRIRERMAQTGERYTTARMHLLSEEMHLLSEGPDTGRVTAGGFVHLPGVHPDLTALRVLLANLGVADPVSGEAPPEALLYGLAGGLSTGVMALRYEDADLSTLWLTGWNPFANSVDLACERLGLHVTVNETGGAKAATGHLAALLAVGAPVIAWVDEASLGHTGMPGEFEGGSYHTIAIYGQDGDDALIGDRGPQPVRVPVQRLAAARARIRKFKHRLLSAGTDEVEVDLVAATEAALVQEGTAGQAGPAATFSLAAVDRLAGRIHGDATKEGWARVFPRGPHLFGALRELYRCVEHGGSGGGLSRRRYAAFLEEAAVLTGRDGLVEVAAAYRELGDHWTRLATEPLTGHELLVATRTAVDATVQPVLDGAPDAADRAAAAWTRLADLRTAVTEEGFPLGEEATDSLLVDLQERVAAVAARERAAAELLARVLG